MYSRSKLLYDDDVSRNLQTIARSRQQLPLWKSMEKSDGEMISPQALLIPILLFFNTFTVD